MRIKVLLAALFLVASTTSAFAAGPYIGIAGGLSILHDGDISVSGVGEAEAEYEEGYSFSVSAGYSFEQPFRLEFEFGYKNNDMDRIYGPGGSVGIDDTDMTVMSYMVNAFYDYRASRNLTYYVGAGLGLLNGEIESDGYSEDQNEFGYQLIVGAAYNFNKHVALDISYRFQHAPSDFSKDGVNIQYLNSNIMGGLRFNF